MLVIVYMLVAPVLQFAGVPDRQRVVPVMLTVAPLEAFVASVYCAALGPGALSAVAYALEALRAPVVGSPKVSEGAVPHEVVKIQKLSVSKTFAVIPILATVLKAMPP
jgi:hypothetical protein